jgi:alpha-beta hydrolase superfamily lysophospholipase
VIWWIVGAIGLIVSGWGVWSTERMLHPQPRPFASSPPRRPLKTIPLRSQEGELFDVWVLEPPDPHGVVVACHGYFANHVQVMGIAEGLCDRGYAVLAFDLRGHGSRPGPCTFGVNEAEDVGVMLRWIRHQPALSQLPVGLFGLSLGGAVACQAAVRHPDCSAIVVDSAYAHLFPVLARRIRREYHLPALPWAWITWWGVQAAVRRDLSRLDPARMASRSSLPLLVIHGEEDESVTVDNARALSASWQGPREQWIEPRIGHVGMFAHDPAGYCNRVAAFFDRWLSAQRPSSRS